jgi:16S rRNA (uracil1498-N3)-methyltransferase
MRTIRIYQPGSYTPGESIALSASASQHVGVVLRMKTGDPLTLFCGDNREFSATILSVLKKQVLVQLHSVITVNRESPCALHLAQGIAKGDGMEWIVQKATELGVASIWPLLTQHGSVKHDPARLIKKHAQWQAIAISACEQSGRNTLPIIHEPCTLNHYLQQCTTSNKWILDPQATCSWRNHVHASAELTLLVGPEGGFHPEEITQAAVAEFKPLTLGPRILRTETAAIAALSVLQATAGDL